MTADFSRVLREPDAPKTAASYRQVVSQYLSANLKGKDAGVVAAVKADLLARREALRKVVAEARLDDEGRANAQAHVEAFLDLLSR